VLLSGALWWPPPWRLARAIVIGNFGFLKRIVVDHRGGFVAIAFTIIFGIIQTVEEGAPPQLLIPALAELNGDDYVRHFYFAD